MLDPDEINADPQPCCRRPPFGSPGAAALPTWPTRRRSWPSRTAPILGWGRPTPPLRPVCALSAMYNLMVLTNEKRGGLYLASFDRSPFKIFSLRFSKESVQTPSCERTKTAQRTLFMSFEINNCFQIAV
jgi:hypothetical protein